MEKKKAPLPPCFLSPAQPCLYTQSQDTGALTHFHNCAAIPCGETEARTTLSETMVTHHLCDTRLAMPGVLSPGSCSQPWEKPSLALQGAPGADREDPSPCAMSPPGPVDAPRCPKWLQSPFGYRLGTGAAQRSPSRPCLGLLQLGALGAPTPAYPVPLTLRTQPWPSPQHMRRTLSASQ